MSNVTRTRELTNAPGCHGYRCSNPQSPFFEIVQSWKPSARCNWPLRMVCALNAGCLTLMMASGLAQAEETNISVGVGGGFSPEFEGAKDYSLDVLPIVSIENFFGFNVDFGSATYDLVKYGNEAQGWEFVAGPLVGIADGRDESDSNALNGLGDVDLGVEVGAFASLNYGPALLDLEVTQEVAGGHEGLQVSLGAGTMIPLAEKLTFVPMVSTTWADSNYTDSFFGVNASQSARSGLSRFDAGAGIKDVSLELGLQYEVTEKISLQAVGGYSRLLGDAANSPLVRGPDGSRDQFYATVGLTYNFSF